jgi:hypothetical protein
MINRPTYVTRRDTIILMYKCVHIVNFISNCYSYRRASISFHTIVPYTQEDAGNNRELPCLNYTKSIQLKLHVKRKHISLALNSIEPARIDMQPNNLLQETLISNAIRIRPAILELDHTDRQTDKTGAISPLVNALGRNPTVFAESVREFPQCHILR